jgi:hypothetical protein
MSTRNNGIVPKGRKRDKKKSKQKRVNKKELQAVPCNSFFFTGADERI